MKKAKNLPSRQPHGVRVAAPAAVRDAIKSKYVPRDPKDGEVMLVLTRPQAGAYTFQEYAAGDLLVCRTAAPQDGISPEWVSDAVFELATQLLTTGDDSLYPILADALTDAGCADEAMIASLRAIEKKGVAGRIANSRPVCYVVTAAKPGYTRSGEGWKKWEQVVVARRATPADHEAVCEQREAQAAESQRVLDGMMNS